MTFYVCPVCQRVFEEHEGLQKDISDNGDQKVFVCPRCQERLIETDSGELINVENDFFDLD